MKYNKDLKKCEERLVEGYKGPVQLCAAITNAYASKNAKRISLADRNRDEFLVDYPQWTEYLMACSEGPGDGPFKGSGSGKGPGDGPGSGTKGKGKGSGEEGEGPGKGKTGDGIGDKGTGDGLGDKGKGKGGDGDPGIPGYTPPSKLPGNDTSGGGDSDITTPGGELKTDKLDKVIPSKPGKVEPEKTPDTDDTIKTPNVKKDAPKIQKPDDFDDGVPVTPKRTPKPKPKKEPPKKPVTPKKEPTVEPDKTPPKKKEPPKKEPPKKEPPKKEPPKKEPPKKEPPKKEPPKKEPPTEVPDKDNPKIIPLPDFS